MTGFSKAAVTESGITATVEIRSVNGRYLEISPKLPKNLTYKELELRDLVKGSMERGNVSVSVKVESTGVSKSSLDADKAAAYYTSLSALKKKLKIAEPVTISDLLQIEDIFSSSEDEGQDEAQWKVVAKALKQAVAGIDTMRKNEGKEIAKDLKERIKTIETTLDEVESLGMKRIPEERERLRARVAQLFDNDEIDEQRLQMEIVLLADKLDISEECVRLRSHIKFFNEQLKSTESLGRTMNFMLQEMNREINTVGSKANDATIARMVVQCKDELERIREQVQNIE